jgi:hypothetical protein
MAPHWPRGVHGAATGGVRGVDRGKAPPNRILGLPAHQSPEPMRHVARWLPKRSRAALIVEASAGDGMEAATRPGP